MPEFTAAQLAEMVEGRPVGPADVTVSDIRALELAGPGDIAFQRDETQLTEARNCRAGVLIAPAEIDGYPGSLIVCEDPDSAAAIVLEAFAKARYPHPSGISARASVSPSAQIGRDVAVGDCAFVGESSVIEDGAVIYPLVYVGRDCRVGRGTVIYPNTSIHDRTVIGANCIIHHNVAIGSEGFGFARRDQGAVKLSQVGRVRIGDSVEIGALTTVDRAMLEETVIEDGVKIDNHCHIAHNCHIGADSILAGYAKVAGSARLGKGVVMAEDSGVTDHVTVGDGAMLGARTGVSSSVPAGQVVLGYPARPIARQRRVMALTGKLPEMIERVRALERAVEELTRRLEGR